MSLKISVSKLIKAIEGSGGIVTTVAQKLDCNRATAHRLINKYPTAKKALESEREKLKDLAESKLVSQIKKENMTAIIFYLKTQAKERGYVEKQQHEVTGKGGAPLLPPAIIFKPHNEDNDNTDSSTDD